MSVRNWIGCLAVAVLATGCGLMDQSDKPEAQAGIKAAGEWLALVDAGNYIGSWDNAAAFFRGAVPRDQWESSMTTFRAPMGKSVSRKIKSARLATTLPGAPDGLYVLIQYDSVLENKKAAIETATMMLETNGQWRVSGYFIR
jgi:hypothetical protein